MRPALSLFALGSLLAAASLSTATAPPNGKKATFSSGHAVSARYPTGRDLGIMRLFGRQEGCVVDDVDCGDGCCFAGETCCGDSCCESGFVCCPDVGGCRPPDGTCCADGSWCEKGSRCVLKTDGYYCTDVKVGDGPEKTHALVSRSADATGTSASSVSGAGATPTPVGGNGDGLSSSTNGAYVGGSGALAMAGFGLAAVVGMNAL